MKTLGEVGHIKVGKWLVEHFKNNPYHNINENPFRRKINMRYVSVNLAETKRHNLQIEVIIHDDLLKQ